VLHRGHVHDQNRHVATVEHCVADAAEQERCRIIPPARAQHDEVVPTGNRLIENGLRRIAVYHQELGVEFLGKRSRR